MKRILEPELIEDDALALACARADFAEANGIFLRFFGELAGSDFAGCALDLGCGPGAIVLRLAQEHPGGTVHGLDGSAAMIRLAEAARRAAPACADRVAFVRDLLPGPTLPRERYDAVLSNSLLHHLALPELLWATIRRRAMPGAPVLVMDLFRPATAAQVREIVAQYAADASPLLRHDFANSLHAAFEPHEIRQQLAVTGLSHLSVRVVSDRHVLISGRLD